MSLLLLESAAAAPGVCLSAAGAQGHLHGRQAQVKHLTQRLQPGSKVNKGPTVAVVRSGYDADQAEVMTNSLREEKILSECERKECCCVIQSPGEQSLLLWKSVMDARETESGRRARLQR